MQAARAQFVDLLRQVSQDGPDLEAAALAFGELVANAMRHAPPGDVSVTLRWSGATATLSVTDSGTGFVPRPSLPDSGEVGGRGLFIVNAMAGPVRVAAVAGGCSVSVDLPVGVRP